jgi:RNA polymerase sigma factor (sigma-70 family)
MGPAPESDREEQVSWACPDLTDVAGDWWELIWRHREDLLRVARRRTARAADAEDIVSEAMLRAAHRPELDPYRLGAWLTTVTVRLCVDQQRRFRRELLADDAVLDIVEPRDGAEQRVCDRAEAEWIAGHLYGLPERQARALQLRSDGLAIDQIAHRMEMSTSAIESLLARARRTMRAVLASAAAALVGICGAFRYVGPTTYFATGAAALGVLVIAALVLVGPPAPDLDRAQPTVPAPTVPPHLAPSSSRPSGEPGTSDQQSQSAVPRVAETTGLSGPVTGQPLERSKTELDLEPERVISDPPDTGIIDRPNAWLQLVPVPAEVIDAPARLAEPPLPR